MAFAMGTRRFHRRYHCQLSGSVRNQAGDRHDVRTFDLSLTGTCLSMPRSAVVALAQEGAALMPGDRLEVTIEAAPKVPALLAPLGGRVRHVRRLSLTEYAVGVRFEERTPAQEAFLARLFERL